MDKEKADFLYDLLQDGGAAANPFIAASDKDLRVVFTKMCMFVTLDLFKITNTCGS